MSGSTLRRRDMALVLLTGAGFLLFRRAGLAAHHYPPLAALGPAPGFLVQPALLMLEALLMRCRSVLATVLLARWPVASGSPCFLQARVPPLAE